MNSDRKEAPKVPLIPASIRIRTEKPDGGWWNWTIEFDEECYENGDIVPWKHAGHDRRHFETYLCCSDVYDPIPDLHWLLVRIKMSSDFEQWSVEEEGELVIISVWYLDAAKIQLQISRQDGDEDFCWNFVLNRRAFIAELDAAYTSFGSQGGWGVDWRDGGTDNGYRKEVLIDDGKFASH